jgi:peptidoglycan-associated lipoprotein
MLGGGGGFGYTVKDSPYSAVADVSFLHAGTVGKTGYNFNILAITGGVRYRLPVKRRDVQPFAQAMVGIAHASGTGAQAPNPAAGNAGGSLALTGGGGLELPVSPQFTVRLFEADYLLTTFDNGSNNKQNNLRFSFGAVFHF